MKILVRNTKSTDWKLVESAGYDNEAELQELLVESPSLIPINEIREEALPLVVAVREFGLPGSGNTDLLCFSPGGDIALIECKLAANPEIKRKVIGQILEYAAYLWGMTYEEVDDRVYQRSGQRLADLVAGEVDGADWDEESFRSSVRDALEQGNFSLLIAVDQINEELGRTIKFLNGCGNPTFSFSALEMERFQEGDMEMLVPNVYGAAGKGTSSSGRKRWNEQMYFEAAEETLSPGAAAIVKNLYSWSIQHAAKILWGTGRVRGSYSFYLGKEDKAFPVFSLLTDGSLWINLTSGRRWVAGEVFDGFIRDLQEIPGFQGISLDDQWPELSIADVFLNQPEALERFKVAVLRFDARVHSEG